jgi:hypothetical protein
LATGWNDDNRRQFTAPRVCRRALEPAFHRALPGGFGRRGKQQRVVAMRLEFQFQLHVMNVAESPKLL